MSLCVCADLKSGVMGHPDQMFKITESSLSNHKIRAYECCEPSCGSASNGLFREAECTFDKLFVGLSVSAAPR